MHYLSLIKLSTMSICFFMKVKKPHCFPYTWARSPRPCPCRPRWPWPWRRPGPRRPSGSPPSWRGRPARRRTAPSRPRTWAREGAGRDREKILNMPTNKKRLHPVHSKASDSAWEAFEKCEKYALMLAIHFFEFNTTLRAPKMVKLCRVESSNRIVYVSIFPCWTLTRKPNPTSHQNRVSLPRNCAWEWFPWPRLNCART